ncbi:MAG: 1-deoxy-D-xylulose-5-phosphate reductoisomerase [Cyanobacteria bacterium P01_H01_bin.74]
MTIHVKNNSQTSAKTVLSLLGSTGSIGTQVLDMVQHFPERYTVYSLSAGRNLALLAKQIKQFHPKQLCIANEADIPRLQALLAAECPAFDGEICFGEAGLIALATDATVNTVVVGLVGIRGLPPSLAALQSGKRLITANKETFVTGGHLVSPYMHTSDLVPRVMPIDSEHVALHQCLQSVRNQSEAVKKLYLTASGGPFRTLSKAELSQVTKAQALKHPNWTMGSKITIDSATMMNKGLEVIEAHWLFNQPYEKIGILVHPESIVHSGVQFTDGAMMMQLAPHDMRGPIHYALTFPELPANPEPAVHLDIERISQFNFSLPDFDKFPCIRLAYAAGELGGSAPVVLNAVDEVAVDLFLNDQIGFMQIPALIEAALTAHQQAGVLSAPTLSEIIEIDQWARRFVHQACAQPVLKG